MRRLHHLADVLLWLPLWATAFAWRTLMFRTTFIAITGSFGKTTAKDCLASILSRAAPTSKTLGNANGRRGIIETILKVRPWHRYTVIEAGTETPYNLWRASLLIRPDIVVILKVGRAHTKSFRTPENVAAEKARLLRFLRQGGVAILNGDDPYVAAMGACCRSRTVFFGSTGIHPVRYSNVSSAFPDRLSFRVEHDGQSAVVRTQLIGAHRAVSVAGAIAAALSCGIPLKQAASAVETVRTHTARLEPVSLPCGAVLLRDEFNGSIDSFEAAARVLREAVAKRRILVASDCSDCRWDPRKRMRFYAQTAKECADVAVFLGERSDHAARDALNAGMAPGTVHAFLSWETAVPFLENELRSGDLVLLRGTSFEHLSRLYFSLLGSVACHKPRCQRHRPCDDCPELGFQPKTEGLLERTCAE